MKTSKAERRQRGKRVGSDLGRAHVKRSEGRAGAAGAPAETPRRSHLLEGQSLRQARSPTARKPFVQMWLHKVHSSGSSCCRSAAPDFSCSTMFHRCSTDCKQQTSTLRRKNQTQPFEKSNNTPVNLTTTLF